MNGSVITKNFAYFSERLASSTGFTPAAITRTRIWSSFGSGRGLSSYFKTSGPPYSCTTIAFMVGLADCAHKTLGRITAAIIPAVDISSVVIRIPSLSPAADCSSRLFPSLTRSFHPAGGEGGSGGGFNADVEGGGGTGDAGDKIGKNSGGIKPAHTSYSGPNWRRNKSENERSKTKTGSKITVPIYGIAAIQQVAQVTRHATIAVASARTIKNKQYKRISPGFAAISLVTVRNASQARQRRRYISAVIKLAISAQTNTSSSMT